MSSKSGSLALAMSVTVLTATPLVADMSDADCSATYSLALDLAQEYLDFRINGGDMCRAATATEALLSMREILRDYCSNYIQASGMDLDYFFKGKFYRELDNYQLAAQQECGS